MMTAAHQSALLAQFNFEGPDKIRVQATSSTEQLLREAGISRPVRFQFYSVEVKRTKLGFWALKNHPDPGEGEPDNVVAVITPPTVPPVRPFIEPREPDEVELNSGVGRRFVVLDEMTAYDPGNARSQLQSGEIIRADNPGSYYDPATAEVVSKRLGLVDVAALEVGSRRIRELKSAACLLLGPEFISADNSASPVERFFDPANQTTPTESLARVFEVPIDESNRLRLVITANVNQALPAPHEPEQWAAISPSNIHIISALHALYACGLATYEIR